MHMGLCKTLIYRGFIKPVIYRGAFAKALYKRELYKAYDGFAKSCIKGASEVPYTGRYVKFLGASRHFGQQICQDNVV